jgi:hypothetical protein
LLRHFLVFAPPPPVSQTDQKNDDEEAEEEAGEEDDANPFFFKIFYNEDYVVLWVPVMVRGEVTFAVHKRSIEVRYVVQPPRPSVLPQLLFELLGVQQAQREDFADRLIETAHKANFADKVEWLVSVPLPMTVQKGKEKKIGGRAPAPGQEGLDYALLVVPVYRSGSEFI